MNKAPEAPAGWYPHPDMVGTERFWDGVSWTAQVVPASTGTTDTVATREGAPTFAWAIAVLPIVWLPLAYIAPGAAHSMVTLVVFIAVSVFLAMCDGKELRAKGVVVEEAWAFLLGIGYLVQRTKRVPGRPVLMITWAVTAFVSLLALTTFAHVYSVAGHDTEQGILADFKSHHVTNAMVSCPDETGRKGATFTCDASTTAGGKGTFTVTIGSGGTTTWVLDGAK